MKRIGFWMVGAVAVAVAMAGCRTLGNKGAEAPALRLDRSAPYGDMASATPDAPTVAAPSASKSPDVSQEPSVLPSTGGASYKLRSGDTLVISLRTTQPEQFEMIVDENGEVKMPYIGAVKAAGLTGSELEDRIQKEYIEKKIYRYLTVHVLVPTRSYFVRGEVRAPGRFPLVGSVTLLQAVTTAGGYTDFADLGDVRLTRGDKTIQLNAKDIERNPEKDIEIEAGDVIVVKRSWY